MIVRVTVPVRFGQVHDDDIERLRARLFELESALGERSAEIAKTKSDLAAFRIRYRTEVGRLHEELDELDPALETRHRGGSQSFGCNAVAPMTADVPRITDSSASESASEP